MLQGFCIGSGQGLWAGLVEYCCLVLSGCWKGLLSHKSIL